MDTHVFLVVLAAALLHATWNAAVKVDGDRFLFMAAMLAFSGFGALATIPFLPIPHPDSWPYILLSVSLSQGYIVFLLIAYRYGDLSHVYPLARGSAPLIVVLLSIIFIGEQLSRNSLLAVLIIAAGIMSLSLTRGAQKLREPRAVLYALGTALFVASYTLVDGVGARLAGNAHSYSAWMLTFEGLPVIVFVLWKRRAQALPQIGKVWELALPMGLMNLAAYWVVIWAMTVAPIALVAALRETGIIFALLIGVFFLKERLSLVKLFSTFTTLVGTVLLKLSRT